MDKIATCRRFQIDFMGLTEPNVDFFSAKVRGVVWDSVASAHNLVRLGLASAEIASGTIYKPGGIFSAALDNGFHRCSIITEDRRGLGRWTKALIAGDGISSLTIITAYVPPASVKHGPWSVYRQQQIVLRQKSDVPLDPRTEFWSDLRSEIEDARARSSKVVLMGDFNASLYGEGNSFAR